MIRVPIGTQIAVYRVTGVNFHPFESDTHVNILCSPHGENSIPKDNSVELKKQLDDYTKTHFEFITKPKLLLEPLF
jgi:hypothetical protein